MTSVKARSSDLGNLIQDLYNIQIYNQVSEVTLYYLHAVALDGSIVYIPTSAIIHVYELRRRTFYCRNITRHVTVVPQREWLTSDLPSF